MFQDTEVLFHGVVPDKLFDKSRHRDRRTLVLEPGYEPIREHIGVCEEVLTGLVDVFFGEWCIHDKKDIRLFPRNLQVNTFMQILVAIIANSSLNKPENRYNESPYGKRIESILDTWAKDITCPHQLIISGDKELYDKYHKTNEVWITSSGAYDTYERLPTKILSTLRVALTHKDWDFFVKTDDDAFVNFKKLNSLLSNIDSNKDFYGGYFPKDAAKHPFAGGGPGIILTRSALLKCWNNLEDIINLHPEGPEDVLLGLAMYKSGVEGSNFPDLFTRFNRHRNSDEDVIRSILEGSITAHPVTPSVMKKIYSLLKLQQYRTI